MFESAFEGVARLHQQAFRKASAELDRHSVVSRLSLIGKQERAAVFLD